MNDKINKLAWILVFLVISIFGLARLTSNDLDNKVEAASKKLYKLDKYGIIEGAEPIIYKDGFDRALVLIHGFGSTPAAFTDLINDIKYQVQSDIYAPLLPYAGRTLQTMSQTDSQVVVNFIDSLIEQISKRYKKVVVVGLSYGGAQLAKLASQNKIPPNVSLVFYSPALYLHSNTFVNRNLARIYSQWRDYCDYTMLGCEYPSYQSADDTAKEQFAKQKDFHVVDIPALLTMYQFDLKNRGDFNKIHRPYNIIMAVDDNRVNYNKIKGICYKNNKYCKFYSFSSGKHVIHWGKNKQAFEKLLINIVNETKD